MKKNVFFAAGLIFFALSVQCAAPKGEAQSKQPKRGSYPCYSLTRQVLLDGKVSTDPAWRNIPAATGFFMLGKGYTMSKQTVVKFARDRENFFIGMECEEPDIKSVKAKCKDGGPLWVDDGIEIFLSPPGADNYFQFIVNTAGARWDRIGAGDGNPSGAWKAAVFKGDGYWSVEVMIPFRILGKTPGEGEIWTGNFCRNIYAYKSGGEGHTSWTYMDKRFHEPQNFADLIIKKGRLNAGEAKKIANEVNSDYRRYLEKEMREIAEKAPFYSAEISIALKEPSLKKDAVFLKEGWKEIKKIVRRLSTLSSKKLRSALSKGKDLLERSTRLKHYVVYKMLKGVDAIPFILRPITNLKLLPDDTVPGPVSEEISIFASPGEYEPARFAIYALSDINALRPEVSDLKGKKGTIPAENIDIRVVKCWYQGGVGTIGFQNRKVLVPELLLKDDSLIKVDREKKKNYIKLNYPEGEKYVCISSKAPRPSAHLLPFEEFPVKDSHILLPVDIPKDTNKQFWITVKVPGNALPGDYTGRIDLKTSKGIAGTLTLKVEVLPIKLSMPYISSSIYYRGRLDPEGKGFISSERKSREQFRKEMENLLAHGVTNPTVYQGFDKKLLGETLKIRQEEGVDTRCLYYFGLPWGFPPSRKVKEVIEFAKSYGIPEVYFYGLDEAKGKRLKSQRRAWNAIREAGGKTFVAGYEGTFEAVGDLLNILVWAGAPSKEEAEKYHKVGHKIFSYANPQVGLEEPETYRRNFGLLLWKNDYDGAMDYAYQASYNNVWNDFDHNHYRDHNFTYPTMDGVIDTIQWEGYREGIDDLRYLTTLLQLIERGKKSGNRKIKEEALAAEKWLEEFDIKEDLDNIRKEIVRRILKLQEKI